MERIDHVILYSADLDREVAFYRDVLGLPFRFRDRGYAEFGLRNLRLGLFDRSGLEDLLGPEGAARRPGGEVLFLVPDVDAWAERLRAAGVRALSGPVDRPWGHRTLHVLDPDGHVVELAQEIPRARPRG
jgi:lactoylglutathione lyase